jgi:hypothetical protein
MTKNVYSGGNLFFEKGDRPDASPEYTGGAATQYSVPLNAQGLKLRADVSYSYVAEQVSNTPVNLTERSLQISNAWWDLRADIALQSPSRQWTTTLFCDNATNNLPLAYSNTGVAAWAALNRPRIIGLQVEYRLKP